MPCVNVKLNHFGTFRRFVVEAADHELVLASLKQKVHALEAECRLAWIGVFPPFPCTGCPNINANFKSSRSRTPSARFLVGLKHSARLGLPFVMSERTEHL